MDTTLGASPLWRILLLLEPCLRLTNFGNVTFHALG